MDGWMDGRTVGVILVTSTHTCVSNQERKSELCMGLDELF